MKVTASQDQDRTAETDPSDEHPDLSAVIEDDSLVEEVSIDGMCGVY